MQGAFCIFVAIFAAVAERMDEFVFSKLDCLNAHFVSLLTTGPWTNLIQKLNISSLPDLKDLMSQLLVRLVDVALRLNGERRTNEGKQSCVEVHGAVRVQRHVHRDETLKGNGKKPGIRTAPAKF